MNIREGVRTSRRYQVRLTPPLSTDLEAFATAHGLRLGSAIRLLVVSALAQEADSAAPPDDSPVALAGLTAAEHAVLMVASVLPEGQRRMRELAPQAAIAAEERLSLFREPGR